MQDLHTEDYFPGDQLESLPDDLGLGDAVQEEEADASDTDLPDAGDADADAPAGADADGGADQDAGDADADADADAGNEPAEPAAPEPKSEDVEGKDKKGPRVPKERLDQALRQRRAAETRVQELEQRLAQLEQAQAEASRPKPLSTEEIQSKMAEANEALIGGDTARAAELQAQVMAALAPAAPVAPAAPAGDRDVVAELEQRLEFKNTLKEISERFPELDENGEDFDEELSAEAVDLQRAYMTRGYTLAEATKKAAEAVAKLHDLADRRAPKEPTKPAAVAAAEAVQAARRQEKIEKATKAPPKIGGNGADSTVEFDIYSATGEEFAALPKAVQDRLLGNTV